MKTLSLALGLLGLAVLPVRAQTRLFPESLGMPVFLGGKVDVDGIAPHLEQTAEAMRADKAYGYDWAFPAVYAKTTRWMLDHVRTEGFFEDPQLVLDEIGMFYEIYARNANAWMSGGNAESHWLATARRSRALGRSGNGARIDTLEVALHSFYDHILVDLPKALYVLRRRHPSRSRDVMKRDFEKALEIFPVVIKEVLADARLTPDLVRALPEWVRRQNPATDPGTLAEVIGRFRQVAWNASMKLEERAQFTGDDAEVDAMVEATGWTRIRLDPRWDGLGLGSGGVPDPLAIRPLDGSKLGGGLFGQSD
jgi:hypothetical protein